MNSNNFFVVMSRKEAIEEQIQVLAPEKHTKNAGIVIPVYFTRTAWDKYVKVPKGMENQQNEIGRLFDILNMFRLGAKKCIGTIFYFTVLVKLPNKGDWESNEKRKNETLRLVTLKAEIGPFDYDDPKPVITISKPQDD